MLSTVGRTGSVTRARTAISGVSVPDGEATRERRGDGVTALAEARKGRLEGDGGGVGGGVRSGKQGGGGRRSQPHATHPLKPHTQHGTAGSRSWLTALTHSPSALLCLLWTRAA